MELNCSRRKRTDQINIGNVMSLLPTADPQQPKARILIVEDEAMIAFALEEILLAGGFEIAGVAGRLETALSMIDGCGFDAAVLDTNLAGVSAGPAAVALRANGRPFIIVSGYLPSQQHDAFSGAPSIQKPYAPQRLVSVLSEILPLHLKPPYLSV